MCLDVEGVQRVVDADVAHDLGDFSEFFPGELEELLAEMGDIAEEICSQLPLLPELVLLHIVANGLQLLQEVVHDALGNCGGTSMLPISRQSLLASRAWPKVDSWSGISARKNCRRMMK